MNRAAKIPCRPGYGLAHTRLNASRPPSLPRGFTLLETLIVLVLLSLMAGLVMARGPARSPAAEVRAGAQTLAQTLRTARAAAIATGAPMRVTVDLQDHRVRPDAAPATALSPALRLTFTPVGGRVGPSGRAVVAFAADGSASGGAFGLASQAARSLVSVDVFTGRVEVALGG